MDYRVVRFSERAPANEMHPLIAKILSAQSQQANVVVERKPPTPKARFAKVSGVGTNATTAVLSY
jgi:hypothetical protein